MRLIGRSFLGAIIALGLVLPARAETLADTLVSAYNNSGLLEQNRALLRAADEDTAIALSRLRPILNWTADLTRTKVDANNGVTSRNFNQTDMNAGITASLLLYDFGRTRFQLDAAKETVLATRNALISAEQQVLFRAVQAHVNVRRNIRFVELRENNLNLLRQELRAAEDRFEVGEVTRTDVAQAEASVAGALSGLAIAQGDLLQAVEEYRSAVGRDPGTLRSTTRLPNLSGDVAAAKSVAVRKHPDIRRAQNDIAAAELNVLAADAAMKPTFSLQGRVGSNDELFNESNSLTSSIGVNASGPIYQGGALSATKRRAVAQSDSLRAVLHLVQLQVQQDVGNAYARLRAARAGVTSSEEQVRAARVAFQGVREEATLGARTTLDVLDAEQELLDAEANLISAQSDVTIAAYAVVSSIGELTARDLRLDVQIYDPMAYYNLVKDAPVAKSKQGRQLDKVLQSIGKY